MFDFDEREFRRRKLRIPGYDYTQDGAYFVTICVEGKEHLFGKVIEERLELNDAGRMLQEVWVELRRRFPFLQADEFVAMPNHVHGIFIIDRPLNCRGEPCVRPAGTDGEGEHKVRPYNSQFHPQGTIKNSLPYIVQVYKSITTHKYIQGVKKSGWPLFSKKLWQRNYYEHIIRNEDALLRIREYIRTNPMRWHLDRENSKKSGADPFDSWIDSFKIRHRCSP